MNPTHVKSLCAGMSFLCLVATARACETSTGTAAGQLSEKTSFSNVGIREARRLPPPIPLTLIYFNLERNIVGKVALEWKTAQEVNVTHFNVEKSLDGRKWSKVGTLKATGREGSIQTYTYTDNSAPGDVNYYRLQVVDDDGRSNYSPVRLILFTEDPEVRIYPTMTNSNSTLYVEGISPENAMVELFSASGKSFHKIKMYSNTITLPGIPPGIYQVRITNLATKSTACLQKIVIY